MEIRIQQINNGTDKDWAVRTEPDQRTYETAFSGGYEECWGYIHDKANEAGEKLVEVVLSGSIKGVRLWRVYILYDLEGETPVFHYPEYTDPKALERLHELIDC